MKSNRDVNKRETTLFYAAARAERKAVQAGKTKKADRNKAKQDLRKAY